ncbi:MAG: hypothetical protein ACYC00_19350 [Eubacteriales bacterium]
MMQSPHPPLQRSPFSAGEGWGDDGSQHGMPDNKQASILSAICSVIGL